MFSGEFTYETTIHDKKEDVWEFFLYTSNLEKLSGFPKVKVVDGERTEEGETIQLQIKGGLVSPVWKARITEVNEGNYFIDKGEKLPFPFITWQHIHRFIEEDNMTIMKDEVAYTSWLPPAVVKTGLKQMFKDREKKIKTIFS
ncbi:SRPBCC family protein [Bacillus sp. FJAT-44742]|uniref:SRPBCC family protein n=1 Tax=Bacillus sp. FJAT-44742 TaxID=2014005 RepID=UPI000C24B8A3|nr:hypothetical protein [Bacillus sp. FJAT-44742]